MSDEICVNIFYGIGRLMGSMANGVHQPTNEQTGVTSSQSAFLGILLMLAIIMSMLQVQQRKAVEVTQKPGIGLLDRDNRRQD